MRTGKPLRREYPHAGLSNEDEVDAFAANFLDACYGPGQWVYDAYANCWVAPDRSYSGPGRRFCIFFRDGRALRQVVPEGALS